MVPWSCLVLWQNLKKYDWGVMRFPLYVLLMFLLFLLAGWALLYSRWYTFTVAGMGLMVLALDFWICGWLRQKMAVIFLFLVVMLTIIFNGYLTARPVVLYNPSVASMVRVGSIPVEDFVYGIVLIYGVVNLYQFFERRESLQKT